MVEFLVERYVSRTDSDALAGGAERVRKAAEQLSREGTPVRLVRSIFVPEDETCFDLYEAESSDAVLEATRRADLRVDRIATAADSDGAAVPESPAMKAASDIGKRADLARKQSHRPGRSK